MKKYTLLNLTLIILAFFSHNAQTVSAVELVTNGGFETGNFAGWTATNPTSPFRLWAVSPSGLGGGPADGFTPVPLVTSVQEGTFNAWNGVAAGTGQSFTLTQDIAIPAATNVRLTWMDRYQMNYTQFCGAAPKPPCGTATYAVEILNTSNTLLQTLYTVVTLNNTNTNTGWVNHIASLTPFSGTTIRLRFRTTVTNSLTGPGQIEIDGVSAQTLQPTSATVSIGGRVQTADGNGISKIIVTLTDPEGGVHTAVTSPFGYYFFEEIPIGLIVVGVAAKCYTFANPTQVISVAENVGNVDFTSIE